MQKKWLFCIMIFFLSQWAVGQKVSDLFKEYARIDNSENVKINKLMMNFCKPFIKDAKGINSVQVICLDECPSNVKEEFIAKARKLKDNNYEPLVISNSEDQTLKILISIKKGFIREMVIITYGDECNLIKISGKINKSLLSSLSLN